MLITNFDNFGKLHTSIALKWKKKEIAVIGLCRSRSGKIIVFGHFIIHKKVDFFFLWIFYTSDHAMKKKK